MAPKHSLSGDIVERLDTIKLHSALRRVAINCCTPSQCPRYTLAFDTWVASTPELQELFLRSNGRVFLENFQKGITSLPKLEKLYLDCDTIYCGACHRAPLDMSSLVHLKSAGFYVDTFKCSKIILPSSLTALYDEDCTPSLNYKDLHSLKQIMLPHVKGAANWADLPWETIEYVAFSAAYWELGQGDTRMMERMETPVAKNTIPLKICAYLESEFGEAYRDLNFAENFFRFLGQRATEVRVWCKDDQLLPFQSLLHKACPNAQVTVRRIGEGDEEDDHDFYDTVKADFDLTFS